MSRELAQPIIVTGALRSGVRLLAAVLDQRPDLASGPELPFIHTIVRQARDIEMHIGGNLAQHHEIEPHTLKRLFRELIADLVAAQCDSGRARRFVLHSFAAAVALDDYAWLLPDARFVFMLRDPRAVAASLRRCDWRDPRTGEALAYTRDAAAAARHVRDLLAIAAPPIQRLTQAGRLRLVRYEALCTRPEAVFDELASFLRIERGRPQIAPDGASRILAGTDNPHPPLNPGALTGAHIDGWRRALSELELGIIDRVAGPAWRAVVTSAR